MTRRHYKIGVYPKGVASPRQYPTGFGAMRVSILPLCSYEKELWVAATCARS